MRATAPALTAHRSRRISVHAEYLLWIGAKSRSNGAVMADGLWTGSGARRFTADSTVRTFHGNGILQIPAIHEEVGIQVRRLNLTLAGVTPASETIFKAYDTYNAAATLWRAEFDGDRNLIAPPERVWRGVVEGAPITTQAIGENGAAYCDIDLTLMSDAWRLTVIPPLTKSDAMQQARQGDQGRRYSNVFDATTQWGETQEPPKKRKKFLGIF